MTDLPRAVIKQLTILLPLTVYKALGKLAEPPQQLQEGRLSKPVVWSVKPRLGKEA